MALDEETILAEIEKVRPILTGTKRMDRLLLMALEFVQNGKIGPLEIDLTADQKTAILADYATLKAFVKARATDL